jgi:hypothetical protein
MTEIRPILLKLLYANGRDRRSIAAKLSDERQGNHF